MTISTFERNATIAEMAVEMDRRGAVIERLEAEVARLTVRHGDATAALAAKDSMAAAVIRAEQALSASLRAERDALKAALEPFADSAEAYDPDEGDDDQRAWDSPFKIGDLRRARAALSPAQGGE